MNILLWLLLLVDDDEDGSESLPLSTNSEMTWFDKHPNITMLLIVIGLLVILGVFGCVVLIGVILAL